MAKLATTLGRPLEDLVYGSGSGLSCAPAPVEVGGGPTDSLRIEILVRELAPALSAAVVEEVRRMAPQGRRP